MFEAGLLTELDLEATSAPVRKAAYQTKMLLRDRPNILSSAKAINANTELSSELRTAAKRHELRNHLDRVREIDELIANAADDVARNTPPIPAAETAGAASIDTEIRTRYASVNSDQRDAMLKDPSVQLAIARAPGLLTATGDLMHASIVDAVRRRLYPEAMAARDLNERVLEAAKVARSAYKQTAQGTFGTAIETHATKIAAA